MNYQKIDLCNMNNGDGLRVVLWVTGCSHHCPGCFNAETWDPTNGDPFGKEQEDAIIEGIKKDWCSGLTLTGGDPLYLLNRKAIAKLCKRIRKECPGKTIWLYTGYTKEEILNSMPTDSDLAIIYSNINVLCEGRFIQELKSPDKKWVGSENQNVILVK